MTLSATADDGDLSLEDWKRVDSACDQFEAAWRAGERPAPEPLLAEVTKPARSRLLRELLIIDLEFRRERGEQPDVAEYAGRFPEDLSVVDGVFVELGLSGETLAPGRERNRDGDSPWHTTPGAGWAGASVTPAEIGPTALGTLRAAGYEVLGELGRGGMGVVYLARKVALNRPCALKMILAGSHGGKSAVARFRVEAEAVARIRHPGIVQIYHVGEADGMPFLELEYLPGGSLEKGLDGTPRPAAEAARLVEALARAIAEAHRRGIVHRDLKPANILMDAGGQPKVADFGLAKILDSEDGLTKTNLVIGSPSYMAPEQAEGNARAVGTSVDVYAIGAILYELLTGRPPFRALTALETLEQVKAIEPVPPSRLQPGLPRDLETVCLKCLEKAPTRRYATSEALAEDLGRYLAGEPIQARPAAFWERAWKWARRRPGAAAAVAISAAASSFLLGGALYYGSKLRDANVRLEKALQQARSAEGTARSATEQAWANAQTADTQRNLALKAFLELANGVQHKLKTSSATLALRQSLLDTAIAGLGEIARSTEESAPNLGRAIAHQKLADVYRQVGRVPEAHKQLELSVGLAKDLLARSSDEPGVLECLGVDYYSLGLLHLMRDQPREAEGLCRRGVQACEAVVAFDPTRPLAREFWIRNSLQLGHSLLWRTARAEALAAFGTTLELARRWAADEPANPMAKNLIGEVQIKLGDTYSLLVGDPAAARPHYLEAIAIGRALMASGSARPQDQFVLTTALANLGCCTIRAGRPAEARPVLNEAIGLLTEIAKANPDNINFQLQVLNTRYEAAHAEWADAHYAEAAARLRPIVEELQRLKREGKLEGQSVYSDQYAYEWPDDLAFCEDAPRLVADITVARSRPPFTAARLLAFRARKLFDRGDWSGLVATAEAACNLQTNEPASLVRVAVACATCIESIDAWTAPEGSTEAREALRRRCADRAIAALSQALDRGFHEVGRFEQEDLKTLRPHPGFRPLVERLRQTQPAR